MAKIGRRRFSWLLTVLEARRRPRGGGTQRQHLRWLGQKSRADKLGEWTPGGSSGGEAAAIAAGMSLVGLGSDYGGSIPWPAKCASLVGKVPADPEVVRTVLLAV